MALTKVTSDIILDGTIANVDLASDIAVTGGQIADNAVTLAKMAGLARGSIILGDSSGDPSAKAIGLATRVLTSDGTDADWAAPAAGGGGIIGLNVPSTGTPGWTKATRETALGKTITHVIVEVQGGGAGGAKSSSGTYTIGGSGGGYAKKFIDVSSITTADIQVGSGGGGASGEGAGTNGTDSYWDDGSLVVTGVKGVGGYGSHVESPGGLGTFGDINIQGGNGGVGYNGGGDSQFGHGGVAPYGVASDHYATGYGGGGGGGDGIDGGSGSNGIVLIWEIGS